MTKMIERVQTGVRMERRLVKVLKALAEYLDISLGDLLESLALHAFEGKHALSEQTRNKIAQLAEIYELDLTAADSHHLSELEQGDEHEDA